MKRPQHGVACVRESLFMPETETRTHCSIPYRRSRQCNVSCDWRKIFMKIRNILVSTIILTCAVVSTLPAWANHASTEANSVLAGTSTVAPQRKGKHYKRGNRGLHRGWYKGRRMAWYSYNPNDSQWVRQSYWANGRRHVRWVRYNY